MKKQFKKSTLIVLALLVTTALSATVFAAGRWVQAWQDDTLKIKFNSAAQTFTDPDDGSKIVPLVYNGRTYLPVRAIAGLAGLGVDYDEASNSVLLTSGENTTGPKPVKDSNSYNGGTTTQSDDSTGTTTYKNSEYGITDSYPDNWSVKEGFAGSVAIFIAPMQKASVNIVTEAVPSSFTLKQYYDASQPALKNAVSNYSIQDTKYVTLGSGTGYQSIYTGTVAGTNMKWLQVFTLKNGRAYILTYTALPSEFDNYLDKAQQIIDDFQVE